VRRLAVHQDFTRSGDEKEGEEQEFYGTDKLNHLKILFYGKEIYVNGKQNSPWDYVSASPQLTAGK